jgi:hypothetical protein
MSFSRKFQFSYKSRIQNWTGNYSNGAYSQQFVAVYSEILVRSSPLSNYQICVPPLATKSIYRIEYVQSTIREVSHVFGTLKWMNTPLMEELLSNWMEIENQRQT